MSTSENKFSRCLLQISTHHLKDQICGICEICVSLKLSALSAVSARGKKNLRYPRFLREVKKFCAIRGFCER